MPKMYPMNITSISILNSNIRTPYNPLEMKNNRPFWLCLILVILFLYTGCRKSDYKVPDSPVTIVDNGEGTGTVTWTKDNEYLLEGFVFVNDGQVLTIGPGTVIRAKTGQGSAASALIVARGGKIMAEGTSGEPIIFTAEGDDLKGSVTIDASGLWGGLIILGNALLNTSTGEARIEGIPAYEPRGVFGGDDDKDNSGILSYLSIRHGGTNIGIGNEINGLTLGAVGSGTRIDHIEVVSNADDGVECFGGSVNLKYVSVSFCDDDAIDFDLGYHGNMQFISAIQSFGRGDRLIEGGGGEDPVFSTPYSLPKIYNGTFIGRGSEIGKMAAIFERAAGGIVANSIFLDTHLGIHIEYVEGNVSSYSQFLEGNLEVKNNIFYHVAGNDPDSILRVLAVPGTDISSQQALLNAYFGDASNQISDPGLVISAGYYNLLPKGDVYEPLADPPNEWFDITIFKGAFYTYNWLNGWTLLNEAGYVN